MKRSARWIRNTHLFDRDDYKCSRCGRKTDRPHARCPACGSDMKGRRNGKSWVDEAAFFEFTAGR